MCALYVENVAYSENYGFLIYFSPTTDISNFSPKADISSFSPKIDICRNYIIFCPCQLIYIVSWGGGGGASFNKMFRHWGGLWK
jgi:hypothetical protein